MPCRCDYPEPSWNKEYQKVYLVFNQLKQVFPKIADWGWRPYDASAEASKVELDEKTEALCKFLNSRRKYTLEKLTLPVQKWLQDHNEKDAQRKAEEKFRKKCEEKFAKQKARNIAKMTPAERKLFGV